MLKFTVEDVKKALGIEDNKVNTDCVTGVSIDSRNIKDGMMFVAIKGERVDGHDYIDASLESGASCVLSEKEMENDKVLAVKDSPLALGVVARAYKEKYNVPTVSVTGSVGKTSTKDMISSVMECLGPCLKTEGNFNNELGLPLTCFNLNETHKSAVLEMGMSAFGEIEYLVGIAKPDVAVITNIGMSHIENLGSREGILKAKMEITKGFSKDNLLIVNNDDDMLSSIDKNTDYKILTYGIDKKSDYMATDIENLGLLGVRFMAHTPKDSFLVTLSVPGIHNVYNALSAIAVGEWFNIPREKIQDAIKNTCLTKMRLTITDGNGITLINDCYNASPDSIKASLNVLKTANGRKIAVLGDVLELGEYSRAAHESIGKMIKDRADIAIFAGCEQKYGYEMAIKDNIEAYYFKTTDEARDFTKDFVKSGDTVLCKASRGMHFEKICDAIGEKMK